MRKLLYSTITILVLLSSIKSSGQAYYKVIAGENLTSLTLRELYPNPNELENVKQGLSLVESFLKKEDLSNTDSASDFGRQLLKLMFEYSPPENSLYEIVDVTLEAPGKATYSVNAYLVFNKSPIKIYKGLFEIGVDLQKKKIIFPVYNALYTNVDYVNVSYHLKTSALQVYLPNLKKGDSYVSFILKNIQEKCPDFIPPGKRLNYVIGNGPFNGLEYFGIHHHLTTSRYFRTSYTLIDVLASGFYKHEIIHYIFSNYNLCGFLTEGVATFFSGGEAKYGTSASGNLDVIKNRIKAEKKFAFRLNNNDSLFNYSPETYLIAALLINSYYKKVGEKKFYEVLIHDLLTLSDAQVLQFFKKELNFKQISDFILAAEAADWPEFYNHTGNN
jgi:hypothetical protein